MVAIIGLIMFAVSSYLALSKKMHLMVPFVVVPVVAVLYFSVLSETGMFDIMVNRLVSLTKGNIYVVMIVTIIASLGYGRYYATKNAAEIAALKASFQNDSGSSKVDFSDNPLARPQLFWVNFVLFVVSLLCFMFMTAVPTYVLFMVFSCLALLINYHTQKEQGQIVRKHSATMLAPAILFMGIGIMVGILNGTGMVTAMVDAVLSVVPSSLARYIHIIYAIIILPLEIFIPYQAFQSMNPLLLGIGAGCGLNSYQVLTCLNISYLNPCSPLVAAAAVAR